MAILNKVVRETLIRMIEQKQEAGGESEQCQYLP